MTQPHTTGNDHSKGEEPLDVLLPLFVGLFGYSAWLTSVTITAADFGWFELCFRWGLSTFLLYPGLGGIGCLLILTNLMHTGTFLEGLPQFIERVGLDDYIPLLPFVGFLTAMLAESRPLERAAEYRVVLVVASWALVLPPMWVLRYYYK